MEYVFDGSFAGYLTAVFYAFEHKDFPITLIAQADYQPNLMSSPLHILTDDAKAQRVMKGLEAKIGKQKSVDFYRNFLSEDPRAWQAGFNIIEQIFKGKQNILDNFGDDQVLYFHQTLKKVSRERHRMKAFTRFNKAADGMFVAIIEPDFNVLPLIAPFFKNRYTDQKWMIYDVRRQYGLLYDLVSISEVNLSPTEVPVNINNAVSMPLDEKDAQYQQLWKRYFKSTNIEARRNMKLHLQHVPKRYWKYLTEKQLMDED